MQDSYLQEEFLRVFADSHRATAQRIVSKLMAAGIPSGEETRVREIVQDELRGLYHGSLVVFDGGSSLADHGLINIVDDKGMAFSSRLHEIGFEVYDNSV
jgi:hypothetical protein